MGLSVATSTLHVLHKLIISTSGMAEGAKQVEHLWKENMFHFI